MKIRNGFVSNSSSSSFCIKLDNLTYSQVSNIENHIEAGEGFGIYGDNYDRWDICINRENNEITGFTIMDNFDMAKFLSCIGIPEGFIEWG